MRRRRPWLLALAMLASCRQAPAPAAPEKSKPELFLLTALPIAWNEDFSFEQPDSPVMAALEQDYRVTLIDLPSQLPTGALLMAAQPRALPAEELVRLDQWVRDGGRLLLLADPLLEWPSKLPIGDKRRAPLAFADTGLLQHWGMRLDAPEQRGPMEDRIGGEKVQTVSPGSLIAEGTSCRIGPGGIEAHCAIDRGRAVIIADADFLNVGPDEQDSRSLAAVRSQLAALTR